MDSEIVFFPCGKLHLRFDRDLQPLTYFGRSSYGVFQFTEFTHADLFLHALQFPAHIRQLSLQRVNRRGQPGWVCAESDKGHTKKIFRLVMDRQFRTHSERR